MTPLHLYCRVDTGVLDELTRALAAVAANLSLLFVADRVREVNHRTVATFASDKARGDVYFLTSDDLNEQFPTSGAFELCGMANWAYAEQWQPDRVRLLQVTIARSLANDTVARSGTSCCFVRPLCEAKSSGSGKRSFQRKWIIMLPRNGTWKPRSPRR